MRKLFFICVLLLGRLAAAQFTQVTGTVVDPNGIAYAQGTITAQLVLTGVTPTLNGGSFAMTGSAGLDNSGSFLMRLADNNVMVPSGLKWRFTVCSAIGTVLPAGGTGPQCFTPASITITGATQSISVQLSAAAPALTHGTAGSSLAVQVNGAPFSSTTLLNLTTSHGVNPVDEGAGVAQFNLFDSSGAFFPGCFLVGSVGATDMELDCQQGLSYDGVHNALSGSFITPVGGKYRWLGQVSGAGEIDAQNAAGSPLLLWPTGSGTLAVSASSPLVEDPVTGNLSCPTCSITTGTVTSVDGSGQLGAETASTIGIVEAINAATPSGVVRGTIPWSVRTGGQTLADADRGHALLSNDAGADTYVLPTPAGTAFANGWYFWIKNGSTTAAVNLTPAGTTTIDGLATLPVQTHTAMLVESDGTNYHSIVISPVGNNAANLVYASPNGTTGPPNMRALVAADLPAGIGTVTSVSFTGGLISIANPTTTPALTVAGTSGGVPYFSSTSTWASSALLTNNSPMLGGGAGNPPKTATFLTTDGAAKLTIGVAGGGNGVLALAGNTSGSVTLTAPATAGTATNPISISNSLQLPSGTVYNWNADTGLSRDSAAVVDVGNGTAGDKSGSLNLTGITMTGILSNSQAGAASAAAVSITGAPFTGGSATTTFPLVYLNSSANAVTGWSTSGTILGINQVSGFAGNAIDIHNNGGSASTFKVDSTGSITTGGSLTVNGSTVAGTGFTNLFASPPAIGGTAANTGAFTTLTSSGTATLNAVVSTTNIQLGAASPLTWSGRAKILSPADGIHELANNAVTGYTRLDFGGTTSSFPALQVNGANLQAELADGSAQTGWSAATYLTATNCANGASPAVCGSAAAGAVALPTGTNPTLTVNTTAVTANSRIMLTVDESLTISATTCNTTLSTLLNPVVTARVAGTSFTFTIGAVIAANPACVSYLIFD